jgi:hypothetical protein
MAIILAEGFEVQATKNKFEKGEAGWVEALSSGNF